MTPPDPSSPPHLAPGAAPLLDLSDDMRIRAIRTERWVGFARARRVLEILQALREHPPSTRPPGLAIFAHSGMGKTMLVEKFRRDNPPTFHPVHGLESTSVLGITLTSRPSERRIYAQLLAALDIGVDQRSATLADLETRAVRLLKQVDIRVLVFDEVHNLLAGSPREQRVMLQLFRFLSNELKASLVCLGVADAREAIAGDTQLARRLDQVALPRWKADEEFQVRRFAQPAPEAALRAFVSKPAPPRARFGRDHGQGLCDAERACDRSGKDLQRAYHRRGH